MIISEKHRFIFFLCPKTASTSVRNALLNLETTYSCMDMYCHVSKAKSVTNKFIWNLYFKFSFIRNPWDRELSIFFQHYTHRKKDKETAIGFRDNRDDSFKNFVITNASRDCYDWTYDNEGNSIDYIGRFETLSSDFKKICSKLKLPDLYLPHMNNNEEKNVIPWRDYYNEELIELVRNKRRRDIETFKYKFED